MDNYPYIIAGLPDLLNDHESHPFDFNEIRNHISANLSDKDKRLIEWFEFGLKQDSRSHLFYNAATSHSNLFINKYFTFDKKVREAKVAYLENGTCDTEFEEYNRLKSIFEIENIFEREKKYDELIWDKINEIVLYELFNINVILAFFAKAQIISRWNALDRETGNKLFSKLVQEVKGTFKGVEYK